MIKIKIIIPAIFILLVISSCKLVEPSNPPKYRIQNYCDYVADFKIIPAGADTIWFNNVQNNTSGDFTNIKEGQVNVIATVQGDSGLYTNNFSAEKNSKYTVTLHDGAIFGQHIIHLEITGEPNL
ncbi:MAG: hypothetical protein ABR936_14680 [Bacteroidota bacterium]|jgi:hypothetical protein